MESNRIIIGRDPMIVDSFCAELIGCKPDEIGYLSYGKQLGLGDYYSPDIEVLELNVEEKPLVADASYTSARTADRYREYIEEDAACSACFSALIYALHKQGSCRFKEKINIGQGFKDKKGEGIGVGNCTNGYTRYAAGCPPKATDIIEMFEAIYPQGNAY